MSIAKELGYRPITPHRPEPLSVRSVPEMPAYQTPKLIGFRPLTTPRLPTDPSFTRNEVVRIYDPRDDKRAYRYRGSPAVDILLAQLDQVDAQNDRDVIEAEGGGSIKVPVEQPEQPLSDPVDVNLPELNDDEGKKITSVQQLFSLLRGQAVSDSKPAKVLEQKEDAQMMSLGNRGTLGEYALSQMYV